jgi:serine/threonine-protein kinase RsbW
MDVALSQFLTTLQSNPKSVRKGLGDIRSWLKTHGISSDAVMNIELVLAEILNNVAEHAYPASEVGQVSVSLRPNEGLLHCHIVDAGYPMPGFQLPDGRPVEIDQAHDNLPEGGFGWFMIHRLTSGLRYERRQDQNHLWFCVPL